MFQDTDATTQEQFYLCEDGVWQLQGGGGGGGSSTFVGLSDTPSSFTGNSLKYVRVNSGETALEFVEGTSYNVKIEMVPVGWAQDGSNSPAALTVHNATEYRAFDPTTSEDVQFLWKAPADLYESVANQVKVRAVYLITSSTTPAAGEGVSWEIKGCSSGSGDSVDCTVGTGANSETADASAHVQYDIVYGEWAAVTITDLAKDEYVRFNVSRDVADAEDDYGQDVGLIALEIKYYEELGAITY